MSRDWQQKKLGLLYLVFTRILHSICRPSNVSMPHMPPHTRVGSILVPTHQWVSCVRCDRCCIYIYTTLLWQHTILAHRTNGRVYIVASVCLSVACNVFIVAKRCVLPKITLKFQIENGLWGVERSRDRWRHVTQKIRDPEKSRSWPQ